LSRIREQGAELWVVAPDAPDKLEAMRTDNGLEFPVLVDPECETTRAYGILNEESGKVPHPTALVIDKEGVVRFVRVDVDYKVRPAPAELFEALAGL
jgi:peroxiredoxin